MTRQRDALLEPIKFATLQVFAELGGAPPESIAELEKRVAEKMARARGAETGKRVAVRGLSEQDKIDLARVLRDLARSGWITPAWQVPPVRGGQGSARRIDESRGGGVSAAQDERFSAEASREADSRGEDPVSAGGKMLLALYGIRSRAAWRRTLCDVASAAGWQVRAERPYHGWFRVLEFLSPASRDAKVDWFHRMVTNECNDRDVHLEQGLYPSIVAHGFGTYILGYSLLKYAWLRFDRVLLCGSILPVDFPWDVILNRGQVGAVRNEYGTHDLSARLAGRYVRGTGPSGCVGFRFHHERFQQEAFSYRHCEYFEAGHIRKKWLPFLNGPANR